MNNYDYKAEKFLDRLYSDLYLEDEVMHTAKPSDSKEEKIRKYLNRLEKVEEIAKNSKYNGIDLLKRLYYKKYVIKEENIPEAYFELQKKMALERGFGHVKISSNIRQELINTVIEDQKKSLDMWLDYFLSNDSMYPEWFKYYAFQGMLKLGSYDKEKATFSKRTESTTNVFVDLNREALALVYDNLAKSINGENVDDEVLNKLLKGGSFKKLYTHFINVLGSVEKDISSNDGIWVKYDQGSNPDKLVKSLEGKGTGWCTAGASTAKIQLEEGDFYVYYTKDSNGEYKQPRIAIRMDGTNQIGEIRGIASHQNLESEMEEVLEEKLKEFPDRDKYKKKVSDMKKLTDLYDKYIDVQKQIDELHEKIEPIEENNYSFDDEPIDKKIELKAKCLDLYEYFDNELFSQEELRFLYEIDSNIEGFGYDKDPRIEEILDKREMEQDLARIFECDISEITRNINDVLSGKKITCFIGYGYYGNIDKLDGITFPKYWFGNLKFGSISKISDVTLPKKVFGDLYFYDTNYISNVVFPTEVVGYLSMDNLLLIENVVLPEIVGQRFDADTRDISNVTFPKYVGGNFCVNKLSKVENVTFPEKVDGSFSMFSLSSATNTKFPKTVDGDFNLSHLKEASNIELPNYIDGCLWLNSLTHIDGLEFPSHVRTLMRLGELVRIANVTFPESLNVDIKMPQLEIAKNVVFPKILKGDFYLPVLEYFENVVFPEYVVGDFDLGISSIDGDEFPNVVGRAFIMEHLKNAKNVVFPRAVGLDFCLPALEYVENAVFPEYVHQYANLSKLKTVKNLKIPRLNKKPLLFTELEDIDLHGIEYDRYIDEIPFDEVKEKLLEKNKKTKKTKKIGAKAYSSIIILSMLTTLISIGLIVLGVFFNR